MTNKKIQELIRVNQAGEMGAKVIYAGQRAALKLKKDKETVAIIDHMKQQEDVHFDFFNNLMKQKKVRPTIMHPVWQIGGFTLGFVTAMIGKKAAMTCTTAVEEVIDEHYQEQLNYLESINKDDNIDELAEKISKFRDEELEHRDIGYDNDAEKTILFKPLSKFIKGTTKFAIAISKKI